MNRLSRFILGLMPDTVSGGFMLLKQQILFVILPIAVVAIIVGCRTPAADNSQSPVFGSCINGLRMIDGAKQQWALEHHASSNAVPTLEDIRPYLGSGHIFEGDLGWLRCPSGGAYTIGRVDELPRCSIPNHNLEFGYVTVVDESGEPIPGAHILVRSLDKDILSVETGTNGMTSVAPFQASMVDVWSTRSNTLTVTKAGYQAETLSNPASWPMKFTLKKNH